MHRSRNRGFSVVELMVAAVIGIIGSIIIFQVFSVFEGQKRNTTGGSDAETNIALATSAIEQAAQQAGYGISFESHLGCTVYQWKDPAGPRPVPPAVAPVGKFSTMILAPVLLERNPDGSFQSISFVRTRGDTSYAVTKLREPMTVGTEDDLKPVNIYGFKPGDVMLIAEKKDTDSNKLQNITCAVADVRSLELPASNPVGNTIPERIVHTRGTYTKPPSSVVYYTQYNKAGGLGTLNAEPLPPAPYPPFPTPYTPITDAATRFKFTANARIMNMGPVVLGADWALERTQFSVRDGQLLTGDPTTPGKTYPLVDGVVFMEAQLGMAATAKRLASEQSVTYFKSIPENPDTSIVPRVDQETWFKLRTVRIAMVVRTSQFDKDYTSPACFSFWGSSNDCTVETTKAIYTVPAGDRNYRHKTIEMIVPLRNFYWRP